MGSLTLNGATSGAVTISPPAVAGTNTLTLPAATGTVLTTAGGQTVSGNTTISGTLVMGSAFTMRNKIINGAMVIDQRNAGASLSVANTGVYSLDRWRISNSVSTVTVQQNSSIIPAGFGNSLSVTVSTTDSTGSHAIQQYIEAFNTVDLAFGTSSASTFTLSFWVRSSVTGLYGVGFQNSANNRSYVATYTINSANTWEQKTITVSGDTGGTWLGATNGIGLVVEFDLGSSSAYNQTAGSWGTTSSARRTSSCVTWANNSGATFYITGVQLEIGTAATPFEYRNYQQELAMCQRYYQQQGTGLGGVCFSTTYANGWSVFAVPMRAAPTITLLTTTPSISVFGVGGVTGSGISLVGVNTSAQTGGSYFQLQSFTGLQDNRGWNYGSTTQNLLSFAAEL